LLPCFRKPSATPILFAAANYLRTIIATPLFYLILPAAGMLSRKIFLTILNNNIIASTSISNAGKRD